MLLDLKLSTRTNITEVIDLGFHSFGDMFIPLEGVIEPEPVFPLIVGLNKELGLFQNLFVSDSYYRYNHLEYSYTSDNSSMSRKHWDNLAHVLSKIVSSKSARVLEIGSNDGYLLEKCKPFANLVFGIDASQSMVDIANSRGVDSVCGIFGEDNEVFDKVIDKVGGTWDLIIANNVLNHANDPLIFLKKCHELLAEDGSLVVEVPYWSSIVVNNRFDQIYHEHQNYFTIKALFLLSRECDLAIVKVEEVDYHGGSLRVVFTKSKVPNSYIDAQIEKEESIGLFQLETYIKFQHRIESTKRKVVFEIIQAKNDCDLIIGVGAAAKSNTFLTYCGLDKTYIDAVTDTSPLKLGKTTPLTRIPIVNDDFLREARKPAALILAWNISNILKPKLVKINSSVRIIEWN